MMTTEKEARFNTTEFRASNENGQMKISGYAAVFDQETTIGDFFREKISRGAFINSIEQDDIRALWSHNYDIVLGRNKNGSLQLREDAHGLGFDLNLPDTSAGRDAYVSIERGDVDGMSIGFRATGWEWTKGEEGKLHLRTIKAAQLFEISPVAFPAYKQTSVSARSAEADQQLVKDIECKWAAEQKASQDDLENRRAKLLFSDMRMKTNLLRLKLF